MKRHRPAGIGLLCATAAIAGLGAPAGAGSVAAAARPNFVVIYSDDHTYRAVGYRNPQVKTPHMDRLAAEGLRLDCMFTASPICAASRASVMTGTFPQQHGTVGLHNAAFRANIVEGRRFPTLPRVLAQSGYRTALFGKSHLGDPTSYGFDEGRETKDQNDEENFPLAVEFLKRQASSDRPFLLWIAPHNPHLGFRAPQRFQDLYKDAPVSLDPNWLETPPLESLYSQGPAGQISFRDSGPGPVSGGPPRTAEQMKSVIRGYYADVSCLDDCIGGFVAELRKMGLWTNTILVYASDNGYHLGNHGLGNKITMHEESVRVPSFVVSPLLTARGAASEALVSTLDIFPTLLDYAGVPAPAHLMGRSLRPVFEDPKATVRARIFSECVGPPESRTGTGHRMVRDARYKYILTGADEEAFFDLQSDPYERRNLAGEVSLAGEIATRRAQVRDWMAAVGEQRIRVGVETVVPAGTRSVKKQKQAAAKQASRQGKTSVRGVEP